MTEEDDSLYSSLKHLDITKERNADQLAHEVCLQGLQTHEKLVAFTSQAWCLSQGQHSALHACFRQPCLLASFQVPPDAVSHIHSQHMCVARSLQSICCVGLYQHRKALANMHADLLMVVSIAGHGFVPAHPT